MLAHVWQVQEGHVFHTHIVLVIELVFASSSVIFRVTAMFWQL
jgi:hypothetical protein